MIRGPALALGVLLFLVGCGESAESSLPVAGLTEVAGPYQTEPYRAFDQALVRRLEEECAASIAEGQLELVLADGRGGGRILLVFASQNGNVGECIAAVDSSGNVTVEGAGSSGGGGGPGLGPGEVRPASGGSSGGPSAWSYLHGPVGADVARVVIVLEDDTQIEASIGGGHFAAWWPSESGARRVSGYDAAGNEVADQQY